MPVLTTPFKTIPATVLTEAVSLEYPKNLLLETELTIKPVAGETWKVEGLSLGFTTNYYGLYTANVKTAKAALTGSLEYAQKGLVTLEAQLVWLKQIEENRHALYTNTPNEETLAGWRESIANIEKGRSELEAGHREIETIEREIAELGKQGLREMAKPLLGVVARLYARSNELVWDEQLKPAQYSTSQGFGYYIHSTQSRTLEYVWRENLNIHTQFNDPIEIGERENLKLTLELGTAPAPKELEGGFEGPFLLPGGGTGEFAFVTPVTAIVNYSN